jgi:carboxymethylenebutenolidase
MTSPHITLSALDGFQSAAYVAKPTGQAKGAIVVAQEIFGVNDHIRQVADAYAAAGYLAIAPALFDRVQRDVALGYSPQDINQARPLKAQVEALPAPGVLQDIQAAVDWGARAGRVGIVGFCWGGLLAWRAAEQVHGLSAAVTYYGGGMTVGTEPLRHPKLPTMAHFADLDTHISIDSVQAFAQAHPEVSVHRYAAQHGFNCDQRAAFDAAAANSAFERSLRHFEQHL